MEFESSITKITLRYQNNFIQVFTSYRITYRIINRIIYCIIYCITQSYHLLYHATVSRYRITYYITLPYNLLYHATVSRNRITYCITYCIINRITYYITQPYHLLYHQPYHATVSLTVHLPLVLILISNSPRILISRQTVGIEIDNSIAICFAEVTFPCCII